MSMENAMNGYEDGDSFTTHSVIKIIVLSGSIGYFELKNGGGYIRQDDSNVRVGL